MRENPRLRWLGRAEPVDELSEELGVSSAMLGSLLAEAAQIAAAEHRAWAERQRVAGGPGDGVTVEERIALLG
jgi:hypothetical protein